MGVGAASDFGLIVGQSITDVRSATADDYRVFGFGRNGRRFLAQTMEGDGSMEVVELSNGVRIANVVGKGDYSGEQRREGGDPDQHSDSVCLNYYQLLRIRAKSTRRGTM